MELDIDVYTDLVPVAPAEARDREGDLRDGYLHARNDPAYAARLEGLASDHYRFDTEHQPCYTFRAGTYDSFNDWRDLLAALAGYPAARPDRVLLPRNRKLAADYPHCYTAWEHPDVAMPFRELLCFPTNEGVIGPVAATTLAADFAAHRDRALRMSDLVDDPFGRRDFLENYDDFALAFQMVADADGPALVVFA
jgi:hypothetical protein